MWSVLITTIYRSKLTTELSFTHLILPMCPYRISGDAVLDEAGKLLLVGVFVLLHKIPHVFWHIYTHNMLAVNFCVEFLTFRVITRKALGAAELRGHQYSMLDWSVSLNRFPHWTIPWLENGTVNCIKVILHINQTVPQSSIQHLSWLVLQITLEPIPGSTRPNTMTNDQNKVKVINKYQPNLYIWIT